MWGWDLNVPVDLYLIQNYYIELRIFFNQLQHDRTRFLEMKILFSSPFPLLHHILNNSCPLYQIYTKEMIMGL